MGDDPWNDDQFRSKKKQLQELRAESKGWFEDIKGISLKERKEQRETINQKIKEYEELSKSGGKIGQQAKELLELQKKQLAVLGKQEKVVGRIQQEVNVTYREFTNFLQTSAAQYNYSQKIAKEYLSISRDIGATAGMSDRLTRSFKDSLEEVEQMGGSMEDITNIMNTMSDESGRMKILDRDDVANIESISKGTNMMAADAARMAEKFDLMGVSTDTMGVHLATVFKESQAIGLNANKVIKVLSSNMNSLQSYSFRNGVKGMTEMAKQAVKMRLDVSDVLQMADKFYQPEAAIEAAANLQMLGGDIAEAFGDPFETMYLARNKPEELAKKLGDMTENMMQFNDETGEYEFPAEVRMQLKSAGEQLGINTEKMIEMARQTSKIKDVKMKFTSLTDSDTKESLASLAKFSAERGEFVIQHKGEELGLDQIGDGLAAEIIKADDESVEDKTDSHLFKNIALNTQTMSEQLVSMKEASMATIAGTTDMYEITAEEMKKNLIGPMKNSMDMMVSKFKDEFKPDDLFDKVQWDTTFNGATEEVAKFVTTLKDKMENFLGGKDDALSDKTDSPSTYKTEQACKDAKSSGQAVKWDGTKCVAEDLVSYPGGGEGRVLTGPFGKIGLDDRDMLLAGDPNKIGGGTNNGGSTEISGTATINVNINSNTAISPYMESQLTSKIIEVYQKIANGDGNVSSVYQAQPSKGSDILYA
jgi:hypothetical protein